MEIRTLGILGIQVTLYISARGGTKEYGIHILRRPVRFTIWLFMLNRWYSI